MSANMPHINSRRNRLLISLLLALPSYSLLYLIRGYDFEGMTLYAHAEYSLMVFCILALLFEFHQFKSRDLDRRLPWKRRPRTRLGLELGLTVAVTPLVVIPLVYLLYRVVWGMELWWPGVIEYTLFAVLFSLLQAVFVNAGTLVAGWKESILRSQALEKENVKAKLGMLRSQVSPHFLFNNFNVLNALIDEDPELAQRYLEKLGVIYRYVLNTRHEEVIRLENELSFIRDYLFLLGIRYEEQLECSIEDSGAGGYSIPPATLQILVENAIRHNKLSLQDPLHIRLYCGEGEYFVVENTLRPKNGNSGGVGFGLNNIRQRYTFLTDRPVIIEQENGTFSVRVPLLTY